MFIFSLQFRTVQTFFAKKAAKYLSEKLQTKVEVGGLYVRPFKSLVLDSLYIEDREKDTLLFSPRLTVDLNLLSLKLRKVSVNTIQMDNGKFHLKQYRDSATNVEFIINYFDTGDPTPSAKPRRPYDVTIDKIVLNNIAFKYQNFNNTKPVKGVNFNDIDLRALSTSILNLDTKNHLVKAGFRNLTFREKSGFYLKNLTTNATIDTNQMEFKELLLETQTTRLSDYLLMKYSTFKDFGKFISKVYMKAHFNNAKVNSSDVTYFAPQLASSNIILELDGDASGFVNDLKARNLAVRSGQATYLKGDFNIKGLPSIKNTMLDLNFDQVSTNKKDLDLIIARATGSKKQYIPAIASKFGNVSFKGRFTGFMNDFIAFGEIKTRLGRVVTDVNMKISPAGYPRYTGVVKAYDFNLGELLDRKDLGRTTLVANIDGSGFKLNSLEEKLKSSIRYFDYKGYRYSNINVNGSFINNLFKGIIKVNDRNVKLDFDGSIDLNPKLPVFNFSAVIRGANLHTLNFTKDTVQIDADLTTNFTGSNLDNIEGEVDINSIRMTNTENSFVVDSVNLRAVGIGTNRELKIQSDILDASIKGEYDLNTFPSYFKSVAARYIPSLRLNYVKPGTQNFEFSLNIKYFEPLSMLLVPQLKIPEQANFNGKFVSAENIANLNGFIKLIEYNKIKVNNLIIDESTSADAMNIFITSDRIDITDSLYIKNVNIANILRNDSLNLNIKLSDKNATNQLDLNSLIEFTETGDEKIRLSVLPSDVIINREVWKIQEKVSFSFDEGRGPNDNFNLFRRTKITGFELFRDNQMLTIDGIISKNPGDELLIGFNKFKLTTFNSLTKPLGISLRGELNGDAKFAGILDKPNVESEIKIDTLHYNNILIGDLTLSAGLDNATNLINVEVDIENQGVRTLDIDGTYDANADQNRLDMNVMMNNNEVIIFQPFLKNLVSDMKGKVSADLKVTGKLTNPQINGRLSLIDAGMTVNYLKTPYRISDDVEVENSIIKLTNLRLKDIRGNEALVNGTVDMANPNIPDIRIAIVADNFMALNTTSKDNPLYYGVAYGTGVFNFNGPTNDMKIDIDAETKAGTVFNIPLNASATVNKNDFITFVAKDSSLNKPKETSFKGLTMNFALKVDEASEVNIFTEMGKLSGRGNSQLSLKITSLGDFEMFGDYLISSGKFDFTAQDFINKIFKISEGGSIRWTGNPQEAQINLKAIYDVRASLAPLYRAANRPTQQDQRVPVEAVMNLSGPLLTPVIKFDINFPSDAYVKDELQSYLGDENNLNQQTLSLIVRRSFADGSGSASLEAAQSTIINAGTELVFNQLNTIIAQSLNLTTVDFNIRSFNDASATFRLLNDRLILTGGITDRATSENDFADFQLFGSSNVARDVEALYLIKKDGSLVLRASNKITNRNFLNINNNSPYVSALGLVYRKDFDNLRELLAFLIGQKRSEERQPEQDKPKNTEAIKPEDITQPEEK
ncbi:MAG: translocation/assembly module TamB domain-containing protein [Daejeonella sp.]|uniref:translocation/assembly module TamB domain-containing protein n=1 Tax=Daejeonella sp. JGW-45 TaxID=3034148 RepID=UPI0023EBAC5E|nr:translocation/assembly module TamB domain-containing protein [Daejeonella sp. JGW-45]